MPEATPDKELQCSVILRIPFPTSRLASTALRALSVDQELSSFVQRSFSVSALAYPSTDTESNGLLDASSSHGLLQKDSTSESDTVLVTHYRATTNRMLRVAVNGFFESLGVVLDTMRELDEDVIEESWMGEDNGDVDVDELKKVQGLEEAGTIGHPDLQDHVDQLIKTAYAESWEVEARRTLQGYPTAVETHLEDGADPGARLVATALILQATFESLGFDQ